MLQCSVQDLSINQSIKANLTSFSSSDNDIRDEGLAGILDILYILYMHVYYTIYILYEYIDII